MIKMTQPTAQELLIHIENKIAQRDYIDSVHKIKLMTTRDVIRKVLETEF
jgi:hypothetical protein